MSFAAATLLSFVFSVFDAQLRLFCGVKVLSPACHFAERVEAHHFWGWMWKWNELASEREYRRVGGREGGRTRDAGETPVPAWKKDYWCSCAFRCLLFHCLSGCVAVRLAENAGARLVPLAKKK